MKARITKRNTNSVIVDINGKTVECALRGKLKQSTEIFVGDFAEVNTETLSIEKVYERKNRLIRPLVANIDQMFIVVSHNPIVDLFLVDQMIMSAAEKEIDTYIVINKEDQNPKDFEEQIKREYAGVVKNIIVTSAENGSGIQILKKYFANKMSVLVGQSSVGKSSLINKLTESKIQQTSELSEKIKRGINTTRTNQIFSIGGGMVIDSPGFSALSLGIINPAFLAGKYTDFLPYATECEYRSCDHIHSENCGVKKAVQEGAISQDRYKRYTILFEKYNDMWQNRYRRNKKGEKHK